MEKKVTGLHYLFWNPSPGMKDAHAFFHEYSPPYDIYWSSQAADEAVERYKKDGISVHRIDFPMETLMQDERVALLIFSTLNEWERRAVLGLLFKNIIAERRWRKWLQDGRPSETE